jgi:hypothetical protein
MHWGHGDDDYSVVARKYLQEPAPVAGEELQLEEEDQLANTSESIASAAEGEDERQQVAPTVQLESSGAANETTRLRPSFFKQLLSRLSSGKE